MYSDFSSLRMVIIVLKNNDQGNCVLVDDQEGNLYGAPCKTVLVRERGGIKAREVVDIFCSLGIVAQTAVTGKYLWPYFSNVLCTVTLYRRYFWALTVQKLYHPLVLKSPS